MIGGKTGTSDEFNNSWFIGFSRDVTIAIWVGYDNTTMKSRKTLGHGQCRLARRAADLRRGHEGGLGRLRAADGAAGPLARGQSPAGRAADRRCSSGQRIDTRDRTAFVEYFRLDDSGRLDETQYRLVSRGHNSVGDNDHQPTYQQSNPFFFAPWFSRNFEGAPQPTYRQTRIRRRAAGGPGSPRRGSAGLRRDERRRTAAPAAAVCCFFGGGRGGVSDKIPTPERILNHLPGGMMAA